MMIRKASIAKQLKWHLPYIGIAAAATLLISFLYFKWYELQPIDLKNKDVFERLMEGNNRFAAGHPRHPDESVSHRHAVAAGQHPFALVITCSDSRVSPELIFDQGLGDLFVIRTAGNLVSEMELGSIQYAVEHLDVKNIIVMGHEDCGAVKALLSNEHFEGHIKTIIDSLIHEKEILPSLKNHDLHAATIANIQHQVVAIANDAALKQYAGKHPLSIRGVLYSIGNGKVNPI
jgi:carbonic anhydrase